MSPEKIIKTLTEYFGKTALPSPRNYPKSFMHYVKVYKYMKERKET